MWDHEIRAMVSTHAIIAASMLMATILPTVMISGFSVYSRHLLWIYSVSSAVTTASVTVFWLLGITSPTKKITLWSKLSKFFWSCLYFFLSCLFFHTLVVLYGAPLIESALETFTLAVLLTSLTTLRCLCVLGPNVQAWIRVFSRHGAMSVWDTCLQITVTSTLIGVWLGAFPIPLDWDRPWQIWPVSCSFGALIGYLCGLVIAPTWIYFHRKQLTYKCK